MNIFAVKDMKAGIYLQPQAQKSVADAMRSWEVVANEGESMITKFPNDFRLHHLASFDEETGEITAFNQPQDLGSAADFVRKPSPSL